MLNQVRHAAFLSEQRKDPVTKELLVAGMEIVICARDQYAYQAETWTGECPFCHGSETMSEVPQRQTIRFSTNRIPFRLGKKPPSWPVFRPVSLPTFDRRTFRTWLIYLILALVIWWGITWVRVKIDQGFASSSDFLEPTYGSQLEMIDKSTAEDNPEPEILSPIDEDNPIQATIPILTPQPNIRQELRCGTTFFTSGMDAFVQKSIKIFSIPRYQDANGIVDAEVIGWVDRGEKLNLIIHQDSPICYHNSLFWYVKSYYSGMEGWVIEWYTPHWKDKVSFDPGRYLQTEPPE
jgi:hypothetical protein